MLSHATACVPQPKAARNTHSPETEANTDNAALVVRQEGAHGERLSLVDAGAVLPEDIAQVLVCLAHRSPCGDTEHPSKARDGAHASFEESEFIRVCVCVWGWGGGALN